MSLSALLRENSAIYAGYPVVALPEQMACWT